MYTVDLDLMSSEKKKKIRLIFCQFLSFVPLIIPPLRSFPIAYTFTSHAMTLPFQCFLQKMCNFFKVIYIHETPMMSLCSQETTVK